MLIKGILGFNRLNKFYLLITLTFLGINVYQLIAR